MKTILVSVSGISPAILTETVWALARESRPVVPDEVVVITTSRGAADIESLLLAPREDWGGRTVWSALRESILEGKSRDALQLSLRVVELPDPVSGVRKKAGDLRTRSDHDAAADFIVQTLAPFADAEDCRVIASIAGGRKTMGALLYAAMSLLGREEDRVTHVLVNEPFETCRDFFYPDQPVLELEARRFGRDPLTIRATDARIELADIPFVPLRNKFAELNEPRRSFAGLVERYSRSEVGNPFRPPRVSLDAERCLLSVNGRDVSLSGRDFLVAAFLHQRAVSGDPHFETRREAEGPFDRFYQSFREDAPFHPAIQRLGGHVTEDDLTKGLAGIRSRLRKAGLGGVTPHLAPERARIGFEMESSSGPPD
ncbi:MAG: CRISPR-associated ring nuclease Csm6 [Verrucomicrobiales bacterium]